MSVYKGVLNKFFIARKSLIGLELGVSDNFFIGTPFPPRASLVKPNIPWEPASSDPIVGEPDG